MTLLWFICGLIIFNRKSVPPGLLGGSIKHTVHTETAQSIGLMLIVPFVMDVARLLCVRAILPGPLIIVYLIVTYVVAIAAMITYYVSRYPRPVGSNGMLEDTDIPAEKADLAQKIARKAYGSTFHLIMSLWGVIGTLFGIWGIIQTTQAIRMSAEHGIRSAGKQWAEITRVLIIIFTLISTTLCVAISAFTFLEPELGQVADSVIPTNTPKPSPSRTPSSSIPTPTAREVTQQPSLEPDSPTPEQQGDALPTMPSKDGLTILKGYTLYEEGLGLSVLLADDLLIASAPVATCDLGADGATGLVHVYLHTDTGWVRKAILQPDLSGTLDPNITPSDTPAFCNQATYRARFGTAIAMSGNLLAVAAPGYQRDDDSGYGAAFIFKRATDDGSVWTPIQMITPSDPLEGTLFATSIAINGDYLAVGTGGGNNEPGPAVYTYVKEGDLFGGETVLAAPDDRLFGNSMAIDGNVLFASVVTAEGTDPSSIYRYDHTDGSWEQLSEFGTGGIIAYHDHQMAVLHLLRQQRPVDEEPPFIFHPTAIDDSSMVWGEIPPLPEGAHVSGLESIAVEGDVVVVGGQGVYFDQVAGLGGAIFVFRNFELVTVLQGITDSIENPPVPGSSVAIHGDIVASGSMGNAVFIFEVPELK